jgi:hypothetical protein
MIKTKALVIALTIVFATSMFATLASAEPNNTIAKVAVAHWTTNQPKAGGWIFASLVEPQDPNLEPTLYIMG